MAEYVDRIDFINKLEVINGCVDCNEKCRDCGVNDIKGMLRSIPAADVAPVVHGNWSKEMMRVTDTFGDIHIGFQCSRCKGIFNKTLFCGGCGATMDEETDNEETGLN